MEIPSVSMGHRVAPAHPILGLTTPLRDQPLQTGIEGHLRAILQLVGEDPNRSELPVRRYAETLLNLTQGYRRDFRQISYEALCRGHYPGHVMVLDLSFTSLCEHQMMPFPGKVRT